MNRTFEADTNNSAYSYSVNMLRLLLGMKLISKEEYERISAISAAYYETEVYCV